MGICLSKKGPKEEEDSTSPPECKKMIKVMDSQKKEKEKEKEKEEAPPPPQKKKLLQQQQQVVVVVGKGDENIIPKEHHQQPHILTIVHHHPQNKNNSNKAVVTPTLDKKKKMMKGEDTGEAQKEEDHHHLQQQQQEKKVLLGGGEGNAETQAVRTSSCTKEEVDAILIQCGRLSRSTGGPSRTYSGSKRSFDFDSPNDIACDGLNRRCSSSSGRERRRTPTTSRDASPSDHHHHHRKRSSSRERRPEDGGESKRASSGGRRVSRSPGKRTTDPTTNPAVAADHHVASSSSSGRPGRHMVSIPPVSTGGTSSSVRTKSSMASGAAAGANRTSRSPRARSPARTARAPSDENAIPPPTTTATQPSLSRSSSRKAEQSPYRRYPLSEINDNTTILRGVEPTPKHQGSTDTKDGNERAAIHTQHQKFNGRVPRTHMEHDANPKVMSSSSKAEDLQLLEPEIVEGGVEAKWLPKSGAAEIPFAGSATSADNPMSQTLTRTRSLRKSRDLDAWIQADASLPNPASYASFLLEDIQNYHQQNTTFSLPACLSKACSILEAVADLNSSCSDNQISEQDHNNASLNVSRFGGRRIANKDLFVESEVAISSDNKKLMEPSLHKYVSVRDLRGGEDMEQQESAGSNSYVSCHPWVSLREPNSADSTGRWFSQSNAADEEDEVGEEVDGLGPIHQRQPQKQLNQQVVVKAKSRHVSSSSSSSSLPDVTANNTLSGSKKKESDNLHLNHHDSGASNRRAIVGSKVSACRVPSAASS